jgi:arylsulfatase A-like enzyme
MEPRVGFAAPESSLADRSGGALKTATMNLACRWGLFWVGWASLVSLLAAAPAGRPNLLLIITDDHGYGDVSTYRNDRDLRTPNIDRLAAEGMLFTGMRSNCTVCSPARAAILSGRYPDRAGVPGVIRTAPENSWGYFNPNMPTLADHLRQAGYHTAAVGKWHLGLTSPNTPNERGFDFFHGLLSDMIDSYTTHLRHGHNYLRRNQEVVTGNGVHATELFTRWAQDYLKSRAAAREPFFLYLAYNAPHFPIEPPAEWLAKVKQRAPDMPEKRALNVALVEHLDDAIGRVLATLKESGLDRTTLVVFTSDNGGSLPHAQNNDPWRDGKTSHYDGGLRVPYMARLPGTIAAGSRSDYQGLTFDTFPTMLELAGIARPEGIDAVSLVPVLRGGTLPATRDLYFVRREGGPTHNGKSYEVLIRGEWKLLQNSPYGALELYNLKLDPQEKKNVVAENTRVVNELSAILRRHVQRGGTVPWQPPER